MDKVREVALKTLYKIDKEKAYSNIALNEILKQNQNKLEARDIGLISEIVYGVTSRKLTLDEIIKKYSKIKINKISPWILNILRMGIYQIIFLDKIPKSAAVNESVNLSKKYGHKGSYGFTNAILRKVDKKDYLDLFEIKDDIQRISKTTSMSEWIVQKLLQQKSTEQVQTICENSNLRPKLTIRVNNLKTNKEQLKKELEKRKVLFEETELEDFLSLKNLKNIENLDLFQNGYFSVQDLSAGLASIVLNPKKGEKVLDACSAPGGKATYMAEIMGNVGEIDAWDIHSHRIKLIEENAKRLGISIINTNAYDATKTNEDLIEKFDKILLDVPCLGLGVIKKKPDIKWQRKKEDVQEISKVQLAILKTCSQYLKKGGELVYSTCSILREENEEIVENFLKENKEFNYCKYSNLKCNNVIEKFASTCNCINIHTCADFDGFFICKLVRK